ARGTRARSRAPRPGRARRQGRQLSGRARGWTAAARRDRASARDAAEGDAVRRADLRPGRRARARGARRDGGPRARGHDDGRRLARAPLRPARGELDPDDGRGEDHRGGAAAGVLLGAEARAHPPVSLAGRVVPPLPRAAGSGFNPYVWAATVEEVAARHGLSPAHVLRFDANVPAFPAPLPLSAESALADRGEYPEGSYRELREAAAGYAGCEPDEVAVDAGADGLIALVARTYLGAGGLAVTESPTYPLYAIASRIEGAEVRVVPRGLDALAEVGREARVVWLCNPGNPSGELLPAVEIARLAEALPDALVAVDEAYFEYAGETVAGAARELPNLVAIRTLSKAFGLAGLRVGYAVASRD